MNLEMLDLKEFVPPFDTLVVVMDKDGNKSVGRISDIKICMNAVSHQKSASYTWRSFEPHIYNPTHWTHIPNPKAKP